MAVTEKELEEFRNTIQRIIDKYISKEKRFSVKNYSQEGLYDLASLLLEKDEKEREKIWDHIDEKRKIAIEKFKKAEYEFLQENLEIQEKKKEYDNIFNSIDDLNLLAEQVSLDAKLSRELDQIF